MTKLKIYLLSLMLVLGNTARSPHYGGNPTSRLNHKSSDKKESSDGEESTFSMIVLSGTEIKERLDRLLQQDSLLQVLQANNITLPDDLSGLLSTDTALDAARKLLAAPSNLLSTDCNSPDLYAAKRLLGSCICQNKIYVKLAESKSTPSTRKSLRLGEWLGAWTAYEFGDLVSDDQPVAILNKSKKAWVFVGTSDKNAASMSNWDKNKWAAVDYVEDEQKVKYAVLDQVIQRTNETIRNGAAWTVDCLNTYQPQCLANCLRSTDPTFKVIPLNLAQALPGGIDSLPQLDQKLESLGQKWIKAYTDLDTELNRDTQYKAVNYSDLFIRYKTILRQIAYLYVAQSRLETYKKNLTGEESFSQPLYLLTLIR